MAPTEIAPGPPATLPGPPRVSHEDLIRRNLARLGWGFSAPALIVIAAFTIFPILFSIIVSFEKVNVSGSGFSFSGLTASNYSIVIKAALWHHALWFTTLYTVVTVLSEIVLGTLFALVLERLTGGRGPMMALLLIPWSLITVVSAELWGYIYNSSYGLLEGLFPNVLGHPFSATIALMVADIWKTTPFVTIIVLAGLVMIPTELFEASEVDGAGGLEDLLAR